jgi:hypothetical protein
MTLSLTQKIFRPGVFVMLIFFSSCGKKSVDIPRGILSKEELVPVLVDIHLAQASLNLNQVADTSRFNMSDYTGFILKSHGITKEKYDTSMAFYTEHAELLDEIYQEVINELSKKQSEVERK